jgi:hypothetical protein
MLESGYYSQFTQKGGSLPYCIPWSHHSNNQGAGLLFSSAVVQPSHNDLGTPTPGRFSGQVIHGSASVVPVSGAGYMTSSGAGGTEIGKVSMIGAFSD